jgi:Tfp pilus assembly protein PilO
MSQTKTPRWVAITLLVLIILASVLIILASVGIIWGAIMPMINQLQENAKNQTNKMTYQEEICKESCEKLEFKYVGMVSSSSGCICKTINGGYPIKIW